MYVVVLLGGTGGTEVIGGDCGYGIFIMVRAEPTGDEFSGCAMLRRNKTYVEPRYVAWVLCGGCGWQPKGNVKYSDIEV